MIDGEWALRGPIAAAATLAIALSGGWPVPGVSGDSIARTRADRAEAIDTCVRNEMSSRGIHGAQLAVARDGEIVFERAYGRKHRDRVDPVDVHTQFRIGSTTKTLTVAAVMQQVQAGAIDLDAPITAYLADFELAEPGQAERIMVRDLLRHSSGLHDTSAMDESDLFGPTDPGAMGRWVAEQRGSTPYAPPSRFWNYSSANYMYAGHILERVTGLSYPDYMDERIFEPAGMLDSTLHAEEAVARGDFAFGHFPNPFSGQLEIYDLNEANNWARHPTGYANSTAGDLVRFASLLMAGGGDVLAREAVAKMQSRQQYRDLRSDQYYGLGTFVEYYRGHEMIHHDGGAWGWSATLKWIPEAGVAVATVSNTYGGIMSTSTYCAIDAYVEPEDPPAPPCVLDRSSWDALIGTYTGSVNSGASWTFHVTRPTSLGNLRLRIERETGEPRDYELTQDCRLWLAAGSGTFQAEGLGQITFIADPVEPGVTWLRNRFFVAGKREEPPVALAIYLPLLERAPGVYSRLW